MANGRKVTALLFFSSRRRHTRSYGDWSSDVCSSDLMIDVGEETGKLPDMLLKIADVYDDEVDNSVAALTSMLEPIMIVFLALIVGTIVLALFTPLISIITGLQQQT